ncbi:hypothetical protein HZB60_04050 [candidate division KSB1 bacterium]|nr:hypothetical protein [candidate division KSB1 bacterium]
MDVNEMKGEVLEFINDVKSSRVHAIALAAAFALGLIVMAALSGCGNKLAGDTTTTTTNTGSQNTSASTGNSNTAGSTAGSLRIVSVAASSVTTVDATGAATGATSYTGSWEDTAITDVNGLFYYTLYDNGALSISQLSTVGSRGSFPWTPLTSGTHLLVLVSWDNRQSAAYEIVTP